MNKTSPLTFSDFPQHLQDIICDQVGPASIFYLTKLKVQTAVGDNKFPESRPLPQMNEALWKGMFQEFQKFPEFATASDTAFQFLGPPNAHLKRVLYICEDFHSRMRTVLAPTHADDASASASVDTSPSQAFKGLTFERMQELVRARDTLVVWKAMAEQLIKPGTSPFETPQNYQQILDRAQEFDTWFEAQKDLQRSWFFAELKLGEKQLATLPSAIGKNKGPNKLWLQKNCFSYFPSVILDMENLTELWLEFNQLSTLPPEIKKLKKTRPTYFTS